MVYFASDLITLIISSPHPEILTDLPELEGITTECAENGLAAIEIFSKSPENHFDAILTDVRMPVIDGQEATRSIRALDPQNAQEIPIITMTANAFDEDGQRLLQSCMSAHFSKPTEPERLYETLGKLIHTDK